MSDPKRPEFDVQFVDIGKTERVSIRMVRAMIKQFALVPPQAYLCALHGLSRWTSEEKSFFEKISKGDRLTVTFQNVKSGSFEPSIYPTILCASHHNRVDIDVITLTPSRNSLVYVPNPSQPVI